jgi:hypothetical protein
MVSMVLSIDSPGLEFVGSLSKRLGHIFSAGCGTDCHKIIETTLIGSRDLDWLNRTGLR